MEIGIHDLFPFRLDQAHTVQSLAIRFHRSSIFASFLSYFNTSSSLFRFLLIASLWRSSESIFCSANSLDFVSASAFAFPLAIVFSAFAFAIAFKLPSIFRISSLCFRSRAIFWSSSHRSTSSWMRFVSASRASISCWSFLACSSSASSFAASAFFCSFSAVASAFVN